MHNRIPDLDAPPEAQHHTFHGLTTGWWGKDVVDGLCDALLTLMDDEEASSVSRTQARLYRDAIRAEVKDGEVVPPAELAFFQQFLQDHTAPSTRWKIHGSSPGRLALEVHTNSPLSAELGDEGSLHFQNIHDGPVEVRVTNAVGTLIYSGSATDLVLAARMSGQVQVVSYGEEWPKIKMMACIADVLSPTGLKTIRDIISHMATIDQRP